MADELRVPPAEAASADEDRQGHDADWRWLATHLLDSNREEFDATRTAIRDGATQTSHAVKGMNRTMWLVSSLFGTAVIAVMVYAVVSLSQLAGVDTRQAAEATRVLVRAAAHGDGVEDVDGGDGVEAAAQPVTTPTAEPSE